MRETHFFFYRGAGVLSGVADPIFYVPPVLHFLSSLLSDLPYESMTGPIGQRVLRYLLTYLHSRVTSQKPMLFHTLAHSGEIFTKVIPMWEY